MTPEDTLALILAVRQFVSCIRMYGSLKCKPVPLPEKPKLLPEHVSVIVPTIDRSDSLITTLETMLANHPQEILVVTTAALIEDLASLVEKQLPENSRRGIPLRILHVPRPNKRIQMVHAINQAQGEVIVLADDDVFWPPTLLKYLLAVLDQKPNVGGVGARNKAHGLESRPPNTITMWEAFEARRLDLLNDRVVAATLIDGNVRILSGRTAAYRATILKDEKFQHAFTHEYWLFGRILLHSGDDQFITRWVFNQGWDTFIQTAPQALYGTTATRDSRHIHQILRWSRNGKRSHIKRLFTSERTWKYPFLAYNTANSVFGPLIFTWQVYLAVKIYRSKPIPIGSGPNSPSKGSLIFWFWFLRPLAGHIWFGLRNRWWLRHLGAQRVKDLTYSMVLNFYVPATLHFTGWGSRNV